MKLTPELLEAMGFEKQPKTSSWSMNTYSYEDMFFVHIVDEGASLILAGNAHATSEPIEDFFDKFHEVLRVEQNLSLSYNDDIIQELHDRGSTLADLAPEGEAQALYDAYRDNPTRFDVLIKEFFYNSLGRITP